MCLCHVAHKHTYISLYTVLHDRMTLRTCFKTNKLKRLELWKIYRHIKYFFSCVLITFIAAVSINNLSAGYGLQMECSLYISLVPPPPTKITEHRNACFLYIQNVSDQNNQFGFYGYRSSLCPDKFCPMHSFL